MNRTKYRDTSIDNEKAILFILYFISGEFFTPYARDFSTELPLHTHYFTPIYPYLPLFTPI